MVPLSEHEQRLFDQIEQALYADDPKFASSVRRARTRSRLRRAVVLGTAGLVVGLGLILVGLVTNLIALSVVGFVLVVGGCFLTIQGVRARSAPAGAPSGETDTAKAAPRTPGIRTRMEDRLRRRFDEN